MKLTIYTKSYPKGLEMICDEIYKIKLDRKGNTFEITEDSGCGFLTSQTCYQGEIVEDNKD